MPPTAAKACLPGLSRAAYFNMMDKAAYCARITRLSGWAAHQSTRMRYFLGQQGTRFGSGRTFSRTGSVSLVMYSKVPLLSMPSGFDCVLQGCQHMLLCLPSNHSFGKVGAR
jgi:hypothetical protein